MADEHGVLQLQLPPDFDDVLGIAGQRRVLSVIISRKVGTSGADVIEQHDLEVAFECRRHEAPHVLVTAEAMRENHGALALSAHMDVVSCQDVHC